MGNASSWMSAGALITALVATIGWSVKAGEVFEKVEKNEENIKTLQDVRPQLQQLTTQQAVQQVQFDALIKELERLNKQLENGSR